MVTRSNVNWEQHKQDIHSIITKRNGIDKANKFIAHYSSRYDKFGRSLMDWKLAFWLMDDYYAVKNIGTRWYACVGEGGTGKTTLLKNVFYFFDETLAPSRVQMDTEGFLKQLKKFSVNDSMKGMFMDEPDDTINTSSNAGKALREVLGKMRQQNLFLGICATDLKDIPIYIFRKLNGIIFLPAQGSYMFFKNNPAKQSYPLQEIRKLYGLLGYKVFYQLRGRHGCLTGRTYNINPFDAAQEREYKEEKAKDYLGSIDRAIELCTPKLAINKAVKEDPINKLMFNLHTKLEMPKTKIAELVGMDRKTVHKHIKKVGGVGIG